MILVGLNMYTLFETAWSTHDNCVAPMNGLSTFLAQWLSNQTCDMMRGGVDDIKV